MLSMRRKGMDTLRTLSGVLSASRGASERHLQHFKIGCLEMERSRRIKERNAFSRRLVEIDSRLRALEEDIRRRKWCLEEMRDEAGRNANEAAADRARPRENRRFVLRY